jgi:hypothetical protein
MGAPNPAEDSELLGKDHTDVVSMVAYDGLALGVTAFRAAKNNRRPGHNIRHGVG